MEQGSGSYVPPQILSDMDDDVIHARMLEALPDDIDKTEGGFAHDFTRPADFHRRCSRHDRIKHGTDCLDDETDT